MKKLLAAGLLSSVFFNPSAFALKVNTHVFIADEIINDLKDGNMTIYVDGKPVYIPVNSTLKNSIIYYPKQFRGGSIGPDAFPDPIVGQMSIHPGSSDRKYEEGAWNTDDWLRHILDSTTYSLDKSFAYGNLVHAASDVVSHSYVNMYAGEAFDYVEHAPVDNEPERRHLMLESYIGSLTPNLSGGLSYNSSVSSPSEVYFGSTFTYLPSTIQSLVRTHGSSSSIKYPKVMQQYKDAENEGMIGGSHLLSIYDTRYKIEQILQSKALSDLDSFFSGGALLDWTNSGLSKSLADLSQKVVGIQYKSAHELQRVNNDINNIITRSSLASAKATEKLATQMHSALNSLISLQRGITSLEREIIDLESKIRRRSCAPWDFICKKLQSEISRHIVRLSDAKSSLKAKVNNFATSKNHLLSAVQKLNSVVKNVNLLKTSIDNTYFELAKVVTKDANPIRAILLNWASGVDSAMSSYRELGLNVMKAEMANQDPLQPVRTWAFTQCNMQKLIGFGEGLGSSACKTMNNGAALLDVLTDISPFVGHGVAMKVHEKVSEMQNSTINDGFQQMFTSRLNDIAPGFIEFIQVLKRDVTPTVLNNEFRDGGTEGYLRIPDMAARVDAELRVGSYSYCNGKSRCFNKFSSPLIFNAIQFSKLALLNESELKNLAYKTNGKVDLFKRNGYANYGALAFKHSILLKGLNSIDGNHQWLGKISPPLPRDKSYSQNYSWNYSDYYGNLNGTILGDSSSNRSQIMYSVFKGPLNEGLFTPNALGFSLAAPILTDTYRSFYDECKGHIFQLDVNDHFCNNVEDKPGNTRPPSLPPTRPPELGCGRRGHGAYCP